MNRAGMKSRRGPSAEDQTDPLVQLARVPRGLPPIDGVIAIALFAWAAAEAIFANGNGTVAMRIVAAAFMTLPLIARRRYPVAVIAVISLTAVLTGLSGNVPEEGATPMASLMVGCFSCALYARPAWTAILAIPFAIAAIGFRQDVGDSSAIDYVILTFIITGSWIGGWMVRQRAHQLSEARAAAPEIARDAALAERERIARELHDVVAHSVSIIAVQAGAAGQQLERDPDKAREHIESVRHGAHEALVELRRLVGILREDDVDYAPQPGLSRLEDLIDEVAAAGLTVELHREGKRVTLPAGVDLAAYRIIQEALTNVRRHSGVDTAQVSLDYKTDSLELAVINGPSRNGAAPRSSDGSGHGLIGMRERVRVYGGEFTAAASADGGFELRATLPFEQAKR
jgi:signal transduction histidine kinase